LKDRVATLVLHGKVSISEIIILEMLRGAKSDKEYNVLYKDISALPQLRTSTEVWETTWKLAYRIRRKGFTIPITDTIKTATVIHYKHKIMHSDKHFTILSNHIPIETTEI
jgi:predicted nucleic acid-binding protein